MTPRRRKCAPRPDDEEPEPAATDVNGLPIGEPPLMPSFLAMYRLWHPLSPPPPLPPPKPPPKRFHSDNTPRYQPSDFTGPKVVPPRKAEPGEPACPRCGGLMPPNERIAYAGVCENCRTAGETQFNGGVRRCWVPYASSFTGRRLVKWWAIAVQASEESYPREQAD